MRTLVEYGGLVFSGRGYLVPGDRAGFGIGRNGLSGFDSSAAATTEDISRPGADGSFALPSYLGGKVRAIEGRAFAPTEAELIELEHRLKAVRNGGAYQTLTYTRGNRVQSTLAQVNGEIEWEHDRWTGRNARFLLSLRSPVPWWEGESCTYEITPDDPAQVVNRGTEPAWPTGVVAGPISAGWSLLGFTVNRAVAAGETVTLDAESGAVVSSLAGELMGAVTGFPLAVPVGVSGLEFRAAGSGSAVVTVTDRFL